MKPGLTLIRSQAEKLFSRADLKTLAPIRSQIFQRPRRYSNDLTFIAGKRGNPLTKGPAAKVSARIGRIGNVTLIADRIEVSAQLTDIATDVSYFETNGTPPTRN
jgi:hypothetical protein